MPFIPHTEEDVRQMLAAIGVDTIDDLFDEIPADLIVDSLDGVPAVRDAPQAMLATNGAFINSVRPRAVSVWLGSGRMYGTSCSRRSGSSLYCPR